MSIMFTTYFSISRKLYVSIISKETLGLCQENLSPLSLAENTPDTVDKTTTSWFNSPNFLKPLDPPLQTHFI